MATYKVIQDIEAEDKILGPLTLRQFIYSLITCFFLYLCFICITKGLTWALVFLLPPALFTGFLAFPFGRDQPTEVWAVAKFSFLFKSRKRIWDQSGVKELVTITVPRKIERIYTNGLSQTEVQSRLTALADTIDSRGWAIKNVNVNLYAQPGIVADSDRLVSMSSIPQSVPDYTIQASDDILDENNNPIAQQFTQMITASTQAHRKKLIDALNTVPGSTPQQSAVGSTPQQEKWFESKIEPQVLEPITPYAPVPAEPATPTADEEALLEKIKIENASVQTYNSHMRTLQPLSEQRAQESTAIPTVSSPEPVLPTVPDQSLQYLARNNDRSVDSLGRERQAEKDKQSGNLDQGEVIVSLR